MVLIHMLLSYHVLRDWGRLCSAVEGLYLLGLLPLLLLLELGPKCLGLGESMPFLPLMAVSVYCALGITYSWVKFGYLVASRPA